MEANQQSGFFVSFIRLSGAYWTDQQRWRPRLLTGMLVLLIVAQVALAIRLNIWSADLFDALERRSTDGATSQIGIFILIIFGIMITNTAHLMVRRHLQIDWRHWLTVRVIGEWMYDARHYQADVMPGDHGNPDGRIAEDIRISTELAIELGSSLLYCILLLVTFVGILWTLSGWVSIAGMLVPGHLVSLAFIYSGLGALVAFTLGRPLVRATDTRQTREAEFRFSLLRAHESGEPIAIAHGERLERERLETVFETISQAWREQSISLARLLTFSSGYVTLAAVLPILIGMPRFLDGTFSLGRLVQSGQAFQQVTAALSWPIDNLALIAQWRASVERVLMLDKAVRDAAQETARMGETALNLKRTANSHISVKDLTITSPEGATVLAGLTLKVTPGEHVLVEGKPEAVSVLFRVLAGIWPWGRGRVDLPLESEMIAIGSGPFLPKGSLHQILAFPGEANGYDEATLRVTLSSLGLSHLVERLDETADWAHILTTAEMQRLSLVRIILLRPHWIVLHDATDALDPSSADCLLRVLIQQLPCAGIIVIGRHPGSPDVFDRRITLDHAFS
jgi:putative ATP-binding cassette transporter